MAPVDEDPGSWVVVAVVSDLALLPTLTLVLVSSLPLPLPEKSSRSVASSSSTGSASLPVVESEALALAALRIARSPGGRANGDVAAVGNQTPLAPAPPPTLLR